MKDSSPYSMKVVLGGLLSCGNGSAAWPPLAAVAVSSTSTVSIPSSPSISMSPAVSLTAASLEMWTSGSAMAGGFATSKAEALSRFLCARKTKRVCRYRILRCAKEGLAQR